MIFIVLGTQKFQCNRLLTEIDELIALSVIDEPVFAQIGYSDYKPLKYDYIEFLDKDIFEDKIKNCSLLITHGGVGTIISGINLRKPTIVFPRLKEYQEHVDDHQLEIAEAFSRKSFVLMCGKNDSLQEQITKSKNFKFDYYVSQRDKTVSAIRDFLGSANNSMMTIKSS